MPTTLTLDLSATGHDCGWYQSFGTANTFTGAGSNFNYIYVINYFTNVSFPSLGNANRLVPYARFTGIVIPNGSTVTSATLSIKAKVITALPNKMYVNAVNNTNVIPAINNKTQVLQRVRNFVKTDVQSLGTMYVGTQSATEPGPWKTKDIFSFVSTMVGSYDFSSGGDMLFTLEPYSAFISSVVKFFGEAAEASPKLEITYIPPATLQDKTTYIFE